MPPFHPPPPPLRARRARLPSASAHRTLVRVTRFSSIPSSHRSVRLSVPAPYNALVRPLLRLSVRQLIPSRSPSVAVSSVRFSPIAPGSCQTGRPAHPRIARSLRPGSSPPYRSCIRGGACFIPRAVGLSSTVRHSPAPWSASALDVPARRRWKRPAPASRPHTYRSPSSIHSWSGIACTVSRAYIWRDNSRWRVNGERLDRKPHRATGSAAQNRNRRFHFI